MNNHASYGVLPEINVDVNKVGRISNRAIELAYASAERIPNRIAAALYFYNRIPPSTMWKNRFSDEAAVLKYLGISVNGAWPENQDILPTSAHLHKPGDGKESIWKYWSISRHSPNTMFKDGRFKLYLSPMCDDLPIVIRELGKSISKSGAHSLKIGRTVHSLLRPDKLMVYFYSLENAVRFARKFSSQIDLIRAQGVPFSYSMGNNGLVSIGFDPPDTVRWRYGKEGQSWRLWVTGCIAEAILRARKVRPKDPLKWILTEIRSQNIDPYEWRPLNRVWGNGHWDE